MAMAFNSSPAIQMRILLEAESGVAALRSNAHGQPGRREVSEYPSATRHAILREE